MNGSTDPDPPRPAIAPFWLSARDHGAIAAILRAAGWLAADEPVDAVTPAGDGNLNLVLRVTAADRRVILKQARPWVEKYPDIAAPLDRSRTEAAFYTLIEQEAALAGMMPRLIAAVPDWHLLLLEDLGSVGDATDLYRRGASDGAVLSEAEIDRLLAYLAALHAIGDPASRLPANAAMLALNHHYIFEQPFSRDGPDADLAMIAATLGARYLAGHGVLLHGDFFPGAWVRSDTGLRIIDPEFCLIGPVAFDLGVMAAHLMMADDRRSVLAMLAARYAQAGGQPLDTTLTARFAGTEIWRRINGVARLPLTQSEAGTAALLDTARALMRA